MMTYLDHIIDNKGLHHVKKKVDTIHKTPEPENVSELQYFIGLQCYYNKFLSNRSSAMAPLYELLRKYILKNADLEKKFDRVPRAVLRTMDVDEFALYTEVCTVVRKYAGLIKGGSESRVSCCILMSGYLWHQQWSILVDM